MRIKPREEASAVDEGCRGEIDGRDLTLRFLRVPGFVVVWGFSPLGHFANLTADRSGQSGVPPANVMAASVDAS